MVGKILIVDDVATNRIVLKVKLAEAGYLPVLAADAATGLALARQERPDLILLDQMLPDLPGSTLLARLRADPLVHQVPVIMLSASTDEATRLVALRAGADDFLTKPAADDTLLARIRGLLRAREDQDGFASAEAGLPPTELAEARRHFRPAGLVALITNRPETALRLRRDMARHLSDRIVTMSGDAALQSQGPDEIGMTPDVFLLETDYRTSGGGLRLMSELRSRSHSRHAAICLLAPQDNPVSAAVAYDLGAGDLVTDAVSGEELALRLKRLMARKHEADHLRQMVQDRLRLAIIDPLTGLYNRRHGDRQLAAIAQAAQVAGRSYAVMMVDLDRFKAVNDRLGHAAGDAVLIEVAVRLGRHLRQGDLLARMGGEEFLIALPDTTLPEAEQIADRLCRAIEESPVPLPGAEAVAVTVSIGLAVTSGKLPCAAKAGIDEVVNRADHALLKSKSCGRNQVTICRSAA